MLDLQNGASQVECSDEILYLNTLLLLGHLLLTPTECGLDCTLFSETDIG